TAVTDGRTRKSSPGGDVRDMAGNSSRRSGGRVQPEVQRGSCAWTNSHIAGNAQVAGLRSRHAARPRRDVVERVVATAVGDGGPTAVTDGRAGKSSARDAVRNVAADGSRRGVSTKKLGHASDVDRGPGKSEP